MRYEPIDSSLFVQNRNRLKGLLLPNSLAVVNANDVLPTNADGSLASIANTDLFKIMMAAYGWKAPPRNTPARAEGSAENAGASGGR